MATGRFIVVEGGDGAGKGTLIRALEPVLRAGGHDVLVTQEPGGTPEGLALRALLLAEAGSVWDAHAELLLMAAARVQHVRRVIEPALAAGRVVLCDRYVGSTLAYQGGGRGIDAGFIRALHRETVGDLQPDLTLLLDVDPAIGLARSRARLGTIDEGRFEALTLAFHERVRATYRTLAAEMPGWVMLDASAEPAAITASARAVM